MARFFIEVAHEAEVDACTRAVEVFLRTGSHFLTHADWGCMDGDHRALLVVDVASKEEALNLIPSAFRLQARVVALNAFTLEQIEQIRSQHRASH